MDDKLLREIESSVIENLLKEGVQSAIKNFPERTDTKTVEVLGIPVDFSCRMKHTPKGVYTYANFYAHLKNFHTQVLYIKVTRHTEDGGLEWLKDNSAIAMALNENIRRKKISDDKIGWWREHKDEVLRQREEEKRKLEEEQRKRKEEEERIRKEEAARPLPTAADGSLTVEYEWRRDELMKLPVGSYKVVIDLKSDDILVTNARMRRSWRKIAEISVVKDTKKARRDAAREVRGYVDKLQKVCKSTVIKTYSRKIADNAPVWQYLDNPHYKRADQMQIYLTDSMEYLYGKRVWVR